MQFAELIGKRVAIWGFGREGKAALMAVRSRCPGQSLVVLCPSAEAPAVLALGLPGIAVDTSVVDAETLGRFDVVIKSPGISPHQTMVREAKASGVRFTSGSQLWFAAHRSATIVCVTATKGKSTTTSLIAFLLRALGVRTALAGNIGLPLLEIPDGEPEPAVWVIELSSFQAFDADARPSLAVINNLLEEHLDWHGSVDQYRADKLKMLEGARICLVNAQDPVLAPLQIEGAQLKRYLEPSGWHVAGGSICRGSHPVLACENLPLPGLHNAENACAALAAVELLGFDAITAATALPRFRPLPHRLHTLGDQAGITFIDDSIATTPAAAMAAYRHVRRDEAVVAWIIGGHDRNLDWTAFFSELREAPPRALVCTGTAGRRVFSQLSEAERTAFHATCEDAFDDAFASALQTLHEASEGSCRVLLLSPGAPSFGQFKDYVARGRRFAALAGFDPSLNDRIEGMGIA